MKSFKRFTATVAALIMVASTGLISTNQNTNNTEVVKAVDDCHDDWLHREGNKIVDKDGNPVWLTGCNWFGYNVGSQVFDGVWSQNMHEMLNQIADHGFNLLRVPMSTELLLQWKNGDPDPATPKVNQYCNPELTLEKVEGGTIMYSFDIWNQAVAWCKENGIKIMIDIHSAETASAGHQVSLWYTDKFSTEDWCTALNWFADYYKDDDTIIAIDLKNEPHGKADVPELMAKWDDSKDPNNWKYAAEQAAAAVLKANPELLIMVEGNEVYPKEGYDWTAPSIDYTTMTEFYYGAWWGGNFRGAKEHPIDLGEHQDQLVYSPHDYGPLVWNQTWFDKDFTTQTLLDDYWYDTWAYLGEDYPLLMGEWGGFIDEEHDADGKNTKWMTLLRDYMIENRIHHTFWCFNENSGDTGGLVYDNFGKWDLDKYALVKPALWQDENGKFISLDHQRPLGAAGNGISVSEYYGGASTPPATTTPTTTTTASQSTTTSKPVVTTTVSKTTTTTPAKDDKIIYGDLDGNEKADLSDLTSLSLYLLGDLKLDGTALKCADVNGDGDVNISDLAHFKQYISKDAVVLGPQK